MHSFQILQIIKIFLSYIMKLKDFVGFCLKTWSEVGYVTNLNVFSGYIYVKLCCKKILYLYDYIYVVVYVFHHMAVIGY